MTFSEYCISKKIDPSQFSIHEVGLYEQLERIFAVTGEKSFTQQKLFLINKTRRKYPLQEVSSTDKS